MALSHARLLVVLSRPGPAPLVAGPAGGHDVRVIDVSGGPPPDEHAVSMP